MRKVVFFGLLFLLVGSFNVQAQAPFYQGKTIRIIAGYPAGDTNDQWPRLFAQFMSKYIPGNPVIIVQNMTGGGSMIAANYVYSVGKNDGLTLGWVSPALYFDQLAGVKEVQFDWPKFTWVGTPVESEHVMYMRADAAYKNVEEIRKATVPPKCGATGVSSTGHYMPKLMEETIGTKFNIVTGYQGGGPVDLAVERGELQCRALTIEAFFNREPFHTWRKNNFVRTIMQTGRKRDSRMPNTPLLVELMEQYKTPEQSRRLAKVVMAAGAFGRPMVASPAIPADRVKILREAFAKATKDPEFIAETKKRKFDLEPASGEEMETLAREVLSQPPEIVEKMKKLLGM
jgi:tripartite-type tricarboxylate transporter receptor subunit TctC